MNRLTSVDNSSPQQPLESSLTQPPAPLVAPIDQPSVRLPSDDKPDGEHHPAGEQVVSLIECPNNGDNLKGGVENEDIEEDEDYEEDGDHEEDEFCVVNALESQTAKTKRQNVIVSTCSSGDSCRSKYVTGSSTFIS